MLNTIQQSPAAYPAAELAGDLWTAADTLAQAIGFPNAAMDPTP